MFLVPGSRFVFWVPVRGSWVVVPGFWFVVESWTSNLEH
jgi:hypothetical protein